MKRYILIAGSKCRSLSNRIALYNAFNSLSSQAAYELKLLKAEWRCWNITRILVKSTTVTHPRRNFSNMRAIIKRAFSQKQVFSKVIIIKKVVTKSEK